MLKYYNLYKLINWHQMTLFSAFIPSRNNFQTTKIPPNWCGTPIPSSVGKVAFPPASQVAKDLAHFRNENILSDKTINQRLNWEGIRLDALFNAIYKGAEVLETDSKKLENVLSNLQRIEQSVASLPNKERPQAFANIEKLRNFVAEIKTYEKELAKWLPAVNKWESSWQQFNDYSNAPRYKGAVLTNTKRLHNAINTLIEYKNGIQELHKGDLQQREQWAFERNREFFAMNLQEWQEDAEKAIDQEVRTLKRAFAKGDKEATRLHRALRNQLTKVINELSAAKEQVALHPELGIIQEKLDGAILSIKKKQNQLPILCLAKTIKPLQYGDDEWQTLAKQRPKEPRGLFRRIIRKLNPEKWSPRVKDIVYRVLAAMQLLAQGVELVDRLQREPKRLAFTAKQMQKQLLEAVPTETIERIERESSHIGTLLSDKYKSPALLTHLTKGRSKDFKEALHRARKQFGDTQPTSEQVSTFMNSYKLQQLVKASPKSTPYHHLSFKEWFNLLSTDPTEQRENAVEQIQTSFARLEALPPSDDEELRKQVSTLQRELLKAVQEAPKDTCPLPEMAFWLQKVEDTCYGIEQLERNIAYRMEKAKQALTIKEEDIKCGQKHLNLIRLGQLIQLVNLPKVLVPLPEGVPTDKVESFLQKHAPDFFENWKKLGELYSNYKDAGSSFLEHPEPKQLLEAIDQAIAKAFKEGSFDELSSLKLKELVETVKTKGHYFMVRSTGAEDSRQTANAGGNVSRHYVEPTGESIQQALGDVVRSYFSYSSLQNRINAGLNPFEQELKMAVTVQQLIGEPVGGAKHVQDIPISMVLFTSEPLYVGGEKFRVMRISATYGHGEAVVAGMGIAADTALLLISEAHPDKLYILYDNKDKPTRLAPVQTPTGVHLAPINNPPELRERPALSEEMLRRLYVLGVVNEKFFDDHPTDMEIVISGGTIYPVQARPINRPDLLPTYLDLKKVAALSENPILSHLQGEMLVPGLASVVIVTRPEEIHYTETLAEAEKTFIKGKHKIVIVSQPEPPNSHPVVNFSGLGMPCLIANGEKVRELKGKIDSGHPLAIDMQAATINLWDSSKGPLENSISHGFTVHPAKVAISLPVAAKLPTAPQVVPQEVKDLLLAVRTASTQKAALEALKSLQQAPLVRSVKELLQELHGRIKALTSIPQEVKEGYAALNELDSKLDAAFAETQTALANSRGDRMRPLFHVKVLESLLTAIPEHRSIGQFNVLDVLPIAEEVNEVIAYQKELSHPAHFASFVYLGSKMVTPAAKQGWNTFLKELETLAQQGKISKEKRVQFNQMMNVLDQMKLFPLWSTFILPQVGLDQAQDGSVLDKVLSTLPEKEQAELYYFTDTHRALQERKKWLGLFSSPATFEKGFLGLQELANRLQTTAFVGPEKSLLAHMLSASPLSRIVAIKSMQELVDTFDLAIKAMKESTSFTDLEKTKLFKRMVITYFGLLEDWAPPLVKKEDVFTLYVIPIEDYLNRLKGRLMNMPDNEVQHLISSPGFNVSIAMFGSGFAVYARPEHIEDIFTLTHQNLLVSMSILQNQLFEETTVLNSQLPLFFKQLFQAIQPNIITAVADETDLPLRRVGMEISEERVVIKYNVPLRVHSGHIDLIYDKRSNEVIFSASFTGGNYGMDEREAYVLKGYVPPGVQVLPFYRWDSDLLLAFLLDKGGVLKLSEPLKTSPQEVNISWKIPNREAFSTAVETFNKMCSLTFIDEQEALAKNLVDAFLANRNIDLESLYVGSIKEGDLARLLDRRLVAKLLEDGKVTLVPHFLEVVEIGVNSSDPDVRILAYNLLIHTLYPKGLISNESVAEFIKKGISKRDRGAFFLLTAFIKTASAENSALILHLETAIREDVASLDPAKQALAIELTYHALTNKIPIDSELATQVFNIARTMAVPSDIPFVSDLYLLESMLLRSSRESYDITSSPSFSSSTLYSSSESFYKSINPDSSSFSTRSFS